jgi:hypothetical protein
MAYTSQDLTSIEQLIAGGVERVRFSDGREVQNMSATDLMAIRSDIVLALVAQSPKPCVRRIRIYTNKDF